LREREKMVRKIKCGYIFVKIWLSAAHFRLVRLKPVKHRGSFTSPFIIISQKSQMCSKYIPLTEIMWSSNEKRQTRNENKLWLHVF